MPNGSQTVPLPLENYTPGGIVKNYNSNEAYPVVSRYGSQAPKHEPISENAKNKKEQRLSLCSLACSPSPEALGEQTITG